jgi:hypothetical protein
MLRFGDAAIFMACSATKAADPGPPWRLYRGPMWLTLNAHRGAFDLADVYVLSAEYGFIRSQQWIQPYEQRMSPGRARYFVEQRGTTNASDAFMPLAHQQQMRPPRRRILVAAGADYRRVLDHYIGHFQHAGWIAADATITHTRGGIGEQRRQLRLWLDAFNQGDHP